ncbi:hypothetical protein ACU4GD_24820 [Cupriavidus basilensis]
MRDLGEAVRQHALSRLPDLLEYSSKTKLTAAGVRVHWAETADEANAIVHRISAPEHAPGAAGDQERGQVDGQRKSS